MKEFVVEIINTWHRTILSWTKEFTEKSVLIELSYNKSTIECMFICINTRRFINEYVYKKYE